jgi:hypothetical protein
LHTLQIAYANMGVHRWYTSISYIIAKY